MDAIRKLFAWLFGPRVVVHVHVHVAEGAAVDPQAIGRVVASGLGGTGPWKPKSQ
jgi:hypothetical protein